VIFVCSSLTYCSLTDCSSLTYIDHGDACSAELHVLVAAGDDGRVGAQVLADELSKDAAARAVKDTHAAHTHEDGIVDEVHHGIDGFIASHAAHVKVLAEAVLALVDGFTSATGELMGVQVGVVVGGVLGVNI